MGLGEMVLCAKMLGDGRDEVGLLCGCTAEENWVALKSCDDGSSCAPFLWAKGFRTGAGVSGCGVSGCGSQNGRRRLSSGESDAGRIAVRSSDASGSELLVWWDSGAGGARSKWTAPVSSSTRVPGSCGEGCWLGLCRRRWPSSDSSERGGLDPACSSRYCS
ncbi:hypothetical protein VTK73DRAFT_9164 [Phialemonium thermophilum]|uniref:Uncharacterized protein n=1 Tax=Phialemonium thermophilum TaxID=223376 RepID=A0ABR3W444_9PEZI